MLISFIQKEIGYTLIDRTRGGGGHGGPGKAARGRLMGWKIESEDALENSNLPRCLAAQKKTRPVPLLLQPAVRAGLFQSLTLMSHINATAFRLTEVHVFEKAEGHAVFPVTEWDEVVPLCSCV